MKIGEIEKDIPVPELKRRGRYIELLRKMEIGDSFFITPEKDDTIKKIQMAIMASVRNFKKQRHIKLVTRSENEGLRVWRFE